MSTASVKIRRSNSSFDLKRLLTLKFAASCSAAEAIPYSQTDHGVVSVKDYHPPPWGRAEKFAERILRGGRRPLSPKNSCRSLRPISGIFRSSLKGRLEQELMRRSPESIGGARGLLFRLLDAALGLFARLALLVHVDGLLEGRCQCATGLLDRFLRALAGARHL